MAKSDPILDEMAEHLPGVLSEPKAAALKARLDSMRGDLDRFEALAGQGGNGADSLQPRQVTFALGVMDEGRTYTIGPAPFVRSQPWRHRLMQSVGPLIKQVAGAPDLEFNTPDDLLKLLPLVSSLLVEAIDEVYELVVMYHPSLEADREWIRDNASEGQLVGAFFKILEVADPFGLKRFLDKKDKDKQTEAGPPASPTTENSPTPDGASAPEPSSN